MKTIRLIASICFFVIALNAITNGQGTKPIKYNTWSATVSGGSMLFYGDLRQFDYYPISKQNGKDWYKFTQDLTERKWGFGLAVTKHFSPMFALQAQIQSGKLAGLKVKQDEYFTASIFEYGVNGIFNFGNLFFPHIKNHKVNIYGTLGYSWVNFKSLDRKISTGDTVHSYGYGMYGQGNAPKDKNDKHYTTEVAIPIGIGFKYKINKHFDIGLDCQLINVNTDKLDAHVRVNTAKDKYGYTSATLTYKIGKNEKSLEWTTTKEMESDELAPMFAAINKKIDSLGEKLNAVDAKVADLTKKLNDHLNPTPEADDDKDGVPNSKDLEPNTPPNTLVNFQGITIPKATANAEMKPQFSVFFPVNLTTIDALNEEKVAAAARMLLDDPTLTFELTGYADKTGNTAYNDKLSLRRAQAVKDKLIKEYGIDGARLTVIGKGDKYPLSTDILSVNRRVDFIIPKKK